MMRKWTEEEVTKLISFLREQGAETYKDIVLKELYPLFPDRTGASVREKAKRVFRELDKDQHLREHISDKVLLQVLRGFYEGVPELELYKWVKATAMSELTFDDFSYLLDKQLQKNKEALRAWMAEQGVTGTVTNNKVAIWLKANKTGTQMEMMALRKKLSGK